MGAFIQNAKLIIDDLKSSWYFRLWAFLWLFCAVTVFACLIILGQRTTEDLHRDVHVYIENATSLTFPRFAIRMEQWERDEGQKITSKVCTHQGTLIHVQPCFVGDIGVSMDKCFVVPGDSITINNVYGELFHGDSHIRCSIYTTGSDYNNSLIIWSDQAPSMFGDVESHDLYVGPSGHVMVVLDQEMIDTHDHGEFALWNKRLEYTSDVSSVGEYNISTQLELSLCLISMNKIHTQPGWVLLMLVVLHSLQLFFTQL